jgi:type III secretion protein L
MEASREQDAEYESARLADRARALKHRAWRRGYEAGRRAALEQFVGPAAAASFASRCLDDRLSDMVMKTVSGLLGELPDDVVLAGRLRRCLDAARAQQLLSVRVCADDYEETQRIVSKLEAELNVRVLNVLSDAGLSPHSLVVETGFGVIDGSLAPQLRALERVMRGAVTMLLDEYRNIDEESKKQLDAAKSAVREEGSARADSTIAREGGEAI